MNLLNRYICEHCYHRMEVKDILLADNPFVPKDTIVGCPKCKAINTLRLTCDEPGCWNFADCGTQSPTGYRSTCWTHAPGVHKP